ncbi:MAG TPA: Gfo/Idh/MocA family oxidoreductase, partial [Ktedonobacteraceae bacterium]|nr:Gfo/Idh/MocA family oxidoreductase [Ktedonobacteraceae bacterium]
MPDVRIAVLGSGFWAQFQLAAWQELAGVEIVAISNRTRSKAEEVARRFHIPHVYTDPEEMLVTEHPDAVDIITDVDTHQQYVDLAVRHHLPVICQKPMAPNLATAEEMLATSTREGVPFYIHENWRWQTPIRHLKAALETGAIGTPFRAHIQFSSSFPVFENQPFLAELEQFILTDIGSHILD